MNAEQSTENNPKKKRTLKKLAKAAGVVFLATALLFLIGAGYVYTHQSKIKNAITASLNEQLNTKVSVGDVSIDFFQKFPEVSVKFSNVRADEALEKSEQSLFLFRAIFVRFSLWDLIFADYTVRKLSFDNGEVNLRVTPSGQPNYIFWKEISPSADGEGNTKIALQDVEINNAKFRYIDENIDVRVLLFLEHLDVQGNFAEKIFAAQITGKGAIEDLTYQDYDFADSIAIATTGKIKAGGESTEISVENLRLQNIPLAGNGSVRDGYQTWTVNTKNAPLRQWLPIIPRQWRPNINPAILGGDARTTIDVVLDENTVDVRANAALADASLRLDAQNIVLKNTNGNIAFNFAKSGQKTTSALRFKNLQAKTRTGDLALSLHVEDLTKPYIDATGQFNVQIAELLQIARPGLLESARGIAKGKFNYRKQFKSWDAVNAEAMRSPKLSGEIMVTDGAMTLQNSNIAAEDINAELTLRNSDLIIKKLTVRETGSDFEVDGVMKNALYFGPNRPVPELNVRLKSNQMDLNRVLAWQWPRRADADSVYSTDRSKPLAVNFRVDVRVKKFNLIKFEGQNLTAEVWSEGQKIKGRNLSVSGLGGHVAGSFAWVTEPSGYRFWTAGDLQNININQLFGGFENFGQNWLLADNIEGIGNATIETSMSFDKQMNFLPASLKLVTDIRIENGQLKGYKPLMSLSSLVDKEKLEDVKFSELENKIAIENQVINIPLMDIKSSALNLRLQGRHGFDQQIDYSIRLSLKDAMGNKRKDRKTDLDEWITEVETTDQPYIWVHVGCHIDDPCLSLDREMVKKGVKEEWKKQGEDIKNIFKPDKKTEPKKDPTKGEVLFEWNEEEPDTTGGGG